MILDSIRRFVAAPEPARFPELALEAFRYQVQRIEPLQRLCEARGVRPEDLGDWRQIPAVPVTAYRSLELAAEPAQVIFRSSGTSGGPRSVHHQPFPDLYREVIEASFPQHCLPYGGPVPILSLIPSAEQLPDSSLSFMADHLIRRYGDDKSLQVFKTRSIDTLQARSWAGSRQRGRQPGLILATAFALAQWLERLVHLDLRFQLPPGTVLFETGGFKGMTQELERSELLAGIAERLGIPPQAVVREYGMTELTSQCYTRALTGGDPDLFTAPPWARVRILDAETLEEAPAGETGLIAVLDLANLGSAVHVLTEDLGVADGEGFRLQGRANGAQLRGCSLAAEEILSG